MLGIHLWSFVIASYALWGVGCPLRVGTGDTQTPAQKRFITLEGQAGVRGRAVSWLHKGRQQAAPGAGDYFALVSF